MSFARLNRLLPVSKTVSSGPSTLRRASTSTSTLTTSPSSVLRSGSTKLISETTSSRSASSSSTSTSTSASSASRNNNNSNNNAPESTATHHLITLKRSPRGLPPPSRLTLESLGLHRLHQSVLFPFSGPVAGKILRVKELVEVRNVREEEGMKMMERRRPEGAGVRVTGRVFGGGKSIGGVSAVGGQDL